MAIDINRGRLRILKEACKLLNVTNVVTTTHADLRLYAVSKWLSDLDKQVERANYNLNSRISCSFLYQRVLIFNALI